MRHVDEYLVLRESTHYTLFIEKKEERTDRCDPVSLC